MDTIYALLIVFVLYCIISDWFMHEYGEKLSFKNFNKFKIVSFFSYQVKALKPFKRLVNLNEDNLAKQPIFWICTVLPLMIAGWIEYKIFLLNPDLLSFENIEQLFKNSAPALYISALTPTLGVLISNIHRTIQTKKQIQVTEVKNISDGFYAHNKYIIEEFNALKFKVNWFDDDIIISSPNKLYKKIFEKSNIKNGMNDEVSEVYLQLVKNDLSWFIRSINDIALKFKKDNLNLNSELIFEVNYFMSNACAISRNIVNLNEVNQDLISLLQYEILEINKFANDKIKSKSTIEKEIITREQYFQVVKKTFDCIYDLVNFISIMYSRIFDIINAEQPDEFFELRKTNMTGVIFILDKVNKIQ
ncbi:hypothetical protein [Providencia sp. PROV075]|uniref:hypothetical protein n=1 Tax=Providencia sp. PROV075 TaxID=2949797 RepID=UPI00234A684A|nr:hypothetical protein [Providencia sp. PROV075]